MNDGRDTEKMVNNADSQRYRTPNKGGRRNKPRKNRGSNCNSEKHVNPKGKGEGQVISEFGTNDVKWYKNVPGSDNWAAISWASPLGFDLNLQYPSTGYDDNNANDVVVNELYRETVIPGIMRLRFAPTFGNVTNNQSAINIAGQRVISEIRSKVRANYQYDRSEVIMLIGAMSSVYMWYEEVCRAYKCAALYNSESRYQPDALCTAMGFSHQFLTENLNDIAGFLKVAAFKIGSINIPDIFDYINRQKWMCQNVYADGEDKRSQLYLFQPAGYYVWHEGEGEEPTYLEYTGRNSVYKLTESSNFMVNSMRHLWNALDTLLSPLLGSDDVGTISGDIVNAYGEGGMMKITYPNDGEALQFVVDAEVGNEISNCTALSAQLVYNDKVTQHLTNTTTGPYLVSNPTIAVGAASGPSDNAPLGFKLMNAYMLNADGMEQGPDTVLTSTRLITTIGNQINQTGSYKIDCCGSEIILSIDIFRRLTTGIINIRNFSTFDVVPLAGNGQTTWLQRLVDKDIFMSPFRWKPTRYVFYCNTLGTSGNPQNPNYSWSATNEFQYQGINCNAQQYTRLPYETLRDIDEYCMTSLFTPNR